MVKFFLIEYWANNVTVFASSGSRSTTENCAKFMLRGLSELTNRPQCIFQAEALLDRSPVMTAPFGWKELTQNLS